MLVERHPFWSDDFDMDLLKVIPGVESALGDMAGTVLFTHGHTTHGRLNHPSVWHHDLGMLAFFGLRDPCKPAHYATSDLVVACTWEEAVRDAWAHSLVVAVERTALYDAGDFGSFAALMYHVRGQRLLAPAEVERIVGRTRRRIGRATERLRAIVKREEVARG